MKRLFLISLIGFMLIGQVQGASSSSPQQTELPPVSYTGTIAQLASNDYMTLPHTKMPNAFSAFCPSGGFDRSKPSLFEQTMKPTIPNLFSKVARDAVISAATRSQGYAEYKPGKNIYDYYLWSGGIAALLGLGLWGMHKQDVLSVNWKHILFCASVASAVGMYGSWDNSIASHSEKEDIINLRTNPTKMVYAVRMLAEGFTHQWTDTNNYRRCNPLPAHEGYFNQSKLGDEVTEDHRTWMRSDNSPSPYNADQLPLRNLKTVDNDEIKQVYEHVYNHLCTASTNMLGAILAAENGQYTIPGAIPLATTAALLASGIGLIRDYRLSRIQG